MDSQTHFYIDSLIIVDIDKKEYLKKFKSHRDRPYTLFIYYDKHNNKLFFDDITKNRSFFLQSIYLLLTKLNKKIESSLFIKKVIDFLNINKNEGLIKFGGLSKLKHKLFIIFNKDSETLDHVSLFNYVKIFKNFDLSFHRDNVNEFENCLLEGRLNLKNYNAYIRLIEKNKPCLPMIDNKNNNNHCTLYEDTESVINFIDHLINNIHNIYIDNVCGLIDYGNLLCNCNLLKNRNELIHTSLYCCNCDDKIDHLNNYHKIKLKIMEFYILKPSRRISFYFDKFLCSQDHYVKWAGIFLSDIKNGILKLNQCKVFSFVSSWILIIDGLDILKKMMMNNNDNIQSSLLNNKCMLSYDNEQYTLKHPYLSSNLIDEKHIKSIENPFLNFNLKGSDVYMLYVNFFLNILSKNNILFKNISIDFGKDYSNFNIKDSEDCYNFFINFIESQKNIKMLSISNGLDYDFKIKDLCYSLHDKEISSIELIFLSFKKGDIENICNLIKSSHIIKSYCFFII